MDSTVACRNKSAGKEATNNIWGKLNHYAPEVHRFTSRMKLVFTYFTRKEVRSQKSEARSRFASSFGLQIKKFVETESRALKVHSFN